MCATSACPTGPRGRSSRRWASPSGWAWRASNRCRPTTRWPGATWSARSCPMLASEGVGLMVWSPLAGGLLSGKFGRGQQGEDGSRRNQFDFPPVDKERAFDCIDAMRPIAQARGVSVAQIALAWLLHQPQVTQRHHRRQAARATGRQPGGHASGLERRRTARARRSQPPAARVSGLDVRAPGRIPAQAAGRVATRARGSRS